MLLPLTVLLTAALCAGLGFLPAKLQKRAPARRDAAAGGGTFVFVWAAALFIWSKPGLAADFSFFRLGTLCALAAWAGGLVCGVRLLRGQYVRNGWPAAAGLVLFGAFGAELLLCNAPFYATHDLAPFDLFDYLAPDTPREADGSVLLQDGQDTLVFENIDRPLYALQLKGLTFLYDGKHPDRQDPLLCLTVIAADEGSSIGLYRGSWDAAVQAPRSLCRLLDLSGKVHTLTLRAAAYDGEYRHYQFRYLLGGLIANAPRAFDFSLVRLAALALLFGAAWALRPGSALWAAEYGPSACRLRPVTVLGAAVLLALAAAAPFADARASGVCTATYNVNDWDGTSQVYFWQHINDWQHEANAQYGSLATSLLHGRLDLELDPPAELLGMENPYDTYARQQQAPDALWDVAFYNGRYYVYFGIVPCLLFQLPFEALTGIPDLPPAPCMAVLAWVYILAAFGAVGQCARRWFPRASFAAVLLCRVGLVVGSPLYFLLRKAAVYDYAILCGAAFGMLALWLWLAAANTPPEHRKTLLARLALGSLCMALVAGCRPQMELFAVLALPVFWPRYITEKRLRTRQGKAEAAAFLLPVLAVAAGLMWYNAARFGSPFDFGANYNLTSNDMTARGWNPGRLGPALFTFFAAPPAVKAVFPYITDFRMQTNYIGTTITELFYGGLLACVPFIWGLAAALPLRRRLAARRDLGIFAALCVGCVLAAAALDCQMAGVLYRYLMDFAPALLLAAALCWLAAEQALAAHADVYAPMGRAVPWLRAGLALAVGGAAAYAFCVFFAAEPWLYSQSPALFQNVSRLVQFWL